MRRIAVTLVLSGCVDTTGGERVTFDAVVLNAALAEGEAGAWVDESSGWSLRLDAAALAVGPVYLWSDEPLLDVNGLGARGARPPRGLLDWVVPSARANGADQLRAGSLRGEVTEQVVIDLLADAERPLGRGRGLAGAVGSGEVWLEPVSGGETLTLEGEASKDDVVVPFSVALTFDDRWVDVEGGDTPVALRRLRGLPVEGDLAEDGLLTVRVDHRAALRGVDWATLPEERPAGGPVYALDRETTAGWALSQRLRVVGSSGPWALGWTPPGG